MAYCGKCGTQLNEGAKFCPKCGSPVHGDATPVSDSKNGYLTIYWEGKWALIDQTISITVNNNYVGDYSYKEGFYEKIPIDSPTMVVEIKYSFYTYRKVLSLYPQENYSYDLNLNTLSGGFGFSLCDDSGNEIQRDSLGAIMSTICFLLPIIGIIYALVVWNEKPGTSRSALVISIIGFIVGLVYFYCRYVLCI